MELRKGIYFLILGTLTFCLIQHDCRKLDGYEFPVYTTVFCPRNQTEWNDRSSSINCNKSNGYLCLPNENITELLEFCYISPFIWIEEGICLYLYKRFSRVNSYNCSSFRSGCHTSSFPSDKLYNYPNCTSIENGCFIADQFCESTTTTDLQETTNYTPVEKENNNKTNNFVGVVLGVMIPIIVFCTLYISFKKGLIICPRHEIDEFNEEKPFFEEEQLEEAKTVDSDNRLEAQMKTDFTTSTEVEKSKVEALNEYLLFTLNKPNSVWTSKNLIEMVEDNIHRTVDNGREDLLEKFFYTIKNDHETMKTLSKCGIKMYRAIAATKMKCRATQLKVSKGCLCFTFSFATESDLEHYLNILRKEDKKFKRNISEAILDKKVMNAFKIDLKRVSWDISEVTVIKESKLYLEEQVLEPANGFAVNPARSKGKMIKVDLLNMDRATGSRCKIVVVAIDIGTLFSGFALSLSYEWRKVYNRTWTDGYLTSHKTPTCLLLKKDLSESFFGYEAENKFTELTPEDRLYSYFYFQRFGSILHSDLTETRDILLYDSAGKSLKASLVFEYCIRYLKKCVHREIEKIETLLDSHRENIKYVFTVPDLKGGKAKLLMREAAIKAGIRLENLIIALEPEAVSMYCQYIRFSKEDTSYSSLDILESGTKYMVVDLGGSSSEVTLHQICEGHNFRTVLPTIIRQWGGKTVNDDFFEFLSELMGENVLQEFKTNHMEEYLQIERVFEAKKRAVNPQKFAEKIRLPIPRVLVNLCTKLHKVNTFEDVIRNNDLHRNHVDYSAEKLVIDHNFFCGFFTKTINGMIKMMDEYLQAFEARNVKCIVIVGGFSQSLLFKEEINKHFRNTSIIIPDRSDLAVLNGAIFLAVQCPDVF